MKRLETGALEPRNILAVFQTLKEFFVVLDGDDDGDGFALARHNFGFGQCYFQGDNLSGGRLGVNLISLFRKLAGLFSHSFIRSGLGKIGAWSDTALPDHGHSF